MKSKSKPISIPAKSIKRDKDKTPREEYPPFNTWEWRNVDEMTSASIEAFLRENSDRHFYLGTDSRQTYDDCKFVTAITAHHPNRGGRVIIHRARTKRYPQLSTRLYAETFRTLETAYYIDSFFKDNNLERIKMCLHIDVNKDLDFESGAYREQLLGLITAQGYDVKCKPESWASTSVADKYT